MKTRSRGAESGVDVRRSVRSGQPRLETYPRDIAAAMSAAPFEGGAEESLAAKAYRGIEELIVTLQLKPGQVVTENMLLAAVEMGRTPVREALQRLAYEGLVTIIPRKGVIISDIDVRSHLEMLRVRREIERLMARMAAQRRPERRRSRYLNIAAELEAASHANDGARYIKLDKELALLIAVDCSNEFASRAIDSMSGLARRFWYYFYRNTDAARTAALHALLARSIADQDADRAAEISDQLSDYREEFARATLD